VKKLLAVIVVLVMVAGISFADVVIGGSTSTGFANNADEGKLEIDQEIDIGVGKFHFDVNPGIDYKWPEKDMSWDYFFGVVYKPISVITTGWCIKGDQDFELRGGEIRRAVSDDAVFHDMNVDFEIDLPSGVGFNTHIQFSVDPDNDFFQGLEISGYWHWDALELTAGYLLTENGLPDKNAPELLDDGGIFAKAKIKY
jgi:hypothetical protein